MRPVDNIILHCSASSFGCVREIRRWHLERGFKDIGYHFVILNGRVIKTFDIPAMNGAIEAGRYLDEDLMVEPEEIGAHTLGYNARSIGICLIGLLTRTDPGAPDNPGYFTPSQMSSLSILLMDLCRHFNIPPDRVLGHCETESGKKEGKTCPNFDVGKIREMLKEALENH